MEKLIKNSLGFDSDLYVYQNKEMFNYSVDTILLGNFVFLKKDTKNMLEIGTNNGALSIFISDRKKDLKIDAIEIQDKAISIAIKNVKVNKKEKQINIIHDDFNDYYIKHIKKQGKKYDSIVCNPPFYKIATNNKRKGGEEIYIATHEVMLNIDQIVKGSSKIIKQKGYLTLVMPIERLMDVFISFNKYYFEPKRIQFIYPRINVKSSLVLIEARFRSGWGPHYLPNLYLHNEDKKEHEYRDEIKRLYKPIKFNERGKNE